MVVLAHGQEIRASDIPPDILEGTGRLLPMRLAGAIRQFPGEELEFIVRSLMDLRLQVEELRRRLDERPQRVQVIDIGEGQPVAEYFSAEELEAEDGQEQGPVLYQSGMTMADVERAAIEAALRESRGNRRRAAEVLGIGERTLYRKIKAYGLE
jgi:DNA-binding NtrC family response regulator